MQATPPKDSDATRELNVQVHSGFFPVTRTKCAMLVNVTGPEVTDFLTKQRANTGDKKVILCLDISGSMSGAALREAKLALERLGHRLIDEAGQTNIVVVTYDDQARTILDKLDPKDPKGHLTRIIAPVTDGGMTSFPGAFQECQRHFDATKDVVIVFFTDGQDT